MTTTNKRKNFGILGAFSLSVGTSIGWGSFVVLLEDDVLLKEMRPSHNLR